MPKSRLAPKSGRCINIGHFESAKMQLTRGHNFAFVFDRGNFMKNLALFVFFSLAVIGTSSYADQGEPEVVSGVSGYLGRAVTREYECEVARSDAYSQAKDYCQVDRKLSGNLQNVQFYSCTGRMNLANALSFGRDGGKVVKMSFQCAQ